MVTIRRSLTPAQLRAFIEELTGLVGSEHVLVDEDVAAGYLVDWTGRFGGPAVAVVRPANRDEVVSVVLACAAAAVDIVTQGGNTGLVGGGVPRRPEADVGPVVVLSTRRLDLIGDIDGAARNVLVGAGATLAAVQSAARVYGFDVGVDLGARDGATIGGMVATNAGGIHVVAHGTMRAQVAGIEAVMANGAVVSRLAGLDKDAAGYDLPGLLCGSEGTLGIITAIRLRLVDRPAARVTALLGVATTNDAVAVLGRLRAALPGLEAVEACWADGLWLVRDALGVALPLDAATPVVLTIEVGAPASGAPRLLDEVSEAVLACPEVIGSAAASDAAGRARLWALRERHTEAIQTLGVPHKLDVGVPVARLASFEAAVRARVADVAPAATCVVFGHLGDGNLHVNIVGPPDDDEAVDAAVLDVVAAHGGTVSAEHGIGVAKTAWLCLCRDAADIAAMRAIKQALDPIGLLNPGVIFE